MKEMNYENLTIYEQKAFDRIVVTFLALYEGFTNKNSMDINYEDENKEIFNGDIVIFSMFITSLFDLFGIELEHLPFKEFKVYPCVIDVINYIFEKVLEDT